MSKRIAAFCSDLIATSGPLSLPDLAARVGAAGLTKARNPASVTKSALTQSRGVIQLPDGRFDSARRMLDGIVLTHRVRAATRDGTVLYAGPELALFDELLSDGPLRIESGGEARRSDGEIAGWVGPPGWLPDVPADALIALRLQSGRLTVRPLADAHDQLAERAHRLRTVAARHAERRRDRAGRGWPGDSWGRNAWAGYGWRDELIGVVLQALVECPDLLAEPMPPLDEVLRLPVISWRKAWTDLTRLDHLHPSADRGEPIVLPDVPPGLREALIRMSDGADLPFGEFAVLQLAAATYRWETRCRHDVQQAMYDRPYGELSLATQDHAGPFFGSEAYDSPDHDEDPPDDHDLRPYDRLRELPDDEMRELHDDVLAVPADVVPLMTGSRRAAQAASSEPHSGRRPR